MNMQGVVLFIFALGLIVLEAIRILLRIKRENAVAATRAVQVRVPEHNCRRDRRTPRGGYINLEETDLKKARKGAKR